MTALEQVTLLVPHGTELIRTVVRESSHLSPDSDCKAVSVAHPAPGQDILAVTMEVKHPLVKCGVVTLPPGRTEGRAGSVRTPPRTCFTLAGVATLSYGGSLWVAPAPVVARAGSRQHTVARGVPRPARAAQTGR